MGLYASSANSLCKVIDYEGEILVVMMMMMSTLNEINVNAFVYTYMYVFCLYNFAALISIVYFLHSLIN